MCHLSCEGRIFHLELYMTKRKIQKKDESIHSWDKEVWKDTVVLNRNFMAEPKDDNLLSFAWIITATVHLFKFCINGEEEVTGNRLHPLRTAWTWICEEALFTLAQYFEPSQTPLKSSAVQRWGAIGWGGALSLLLFVLAATNAGRAPKVAATMVQRAAAENLLILLCNTWLYLDEKLWWWEMSFL